MKALVAYALRDTTTLTANELAFQPAFTASASPV